MKYESNDATKRSHNQIFSLFSKSSLHFHMNTYSCACFQNTTSSSQQQKNCWRFWKIFLVVVIATIKLASAPRTNIYYYFDFDIILCLKHVRACICVTSKLHSEFDVSRFNREIQRHSSYSLASEFLQKKKTVNKLFAWAQNVTCNSTKSCLVHSFHWLLSHFWIEIKYAQNGKYIGHCENVEKC